MAPTTGYVTSAAAPPAMPAATEPNASRSPLAKLLGSSVSADLTEVVVAFRASVPFPDWFRVRFRGLGLELGLG